MDETTRRLQTLKAADADVPDAPALLVTLDEVRLVTGALKKPVNVLAPFVKGATVAEFGEAGAKRSGGGALACAASTVLLQASREMQNQGSFDWTNDSALSVEVQKLLG